MKSDIPCFPPQLCHWSHNMRCYIWPCHHLSPSDRDPGILTHWTHCHSHLQILHFCAPNSWLLLSVPFGDSVFSFQMQTLRFSGSWSQSLPFSSSSESPHFYLSTLDYFPENQKVLENQADTWDPACVSQIQNSSISQSSFSSLGNSSQPITPQSAKLWSQRLYRHSSSPVPFSTTSLNYWVLKF